MNRIGVLQRYVDAWVCSDLETLFATYHPDVVVHYGGSSPFAGDHHGRDALLSLLAETARRSGRTLVSVDAVYDLGGHGAIFVREAFEIAGERVILDRCLRYRVDGDLIVEVWLYDHQQQLVDRAWSQP